MEKTERRYMKQSKLGIFIAVVVKPNAKTSRILGSLSSPDATDDFLDISLAAPPRDGEANAELLDLMRGVLGVKKSDLSLAAGGKSRDKCVVVAASAGLTFDKIEELINTSLK